MGPLHHAGFAVLHLQRVRHVRRRVDDGRVELELSTNTTNERKRAQPRARERSSEHAAQMCVKVAEAA